MQRHPNEHGQTMAEYALVMGVICLGVITALGIFSSTVSDAIKAAAKLIP
jgi:Flp pilus assembly pilin Flp